MENLNEVIEQMRDIGDRLVPFNFPQNDPRLESYLNLLKVRDVEIDGYSVTLHFSRADYETHYLETLQVMSKNGVFLPFNLVAKVGQMFLGGHNLYLVEIFKDGKKIYCWTITLDKGGRPILPKNHEFAEDCIYDGFKYKYMYPSQIDFY